VIEEGIIEGVKPGTITDLTGWIKESKAILNF